MSEKRKGERMAFTHLHVHTSYSLLDGAGKIPEMVERAKELGMDALAITDHGVMYGCVDFYKACLAAGIRPILGCEVYVAPNSRFDREPSGEKRYYHLVLLAENNTGYQNLIKIVSKGFVDGFYYKPRVDYELLERFHEGIIALSACLAGEIPTALRLGLYEEAKERALHMRSIFGEDNFFLELQDHGIPDQKLVNQGLLELSRELGIPLVCTNDIHYTNASDAEAHDVLLCIQTQAKVTDTDRMRYDGGQYYMKSEQEMQALFPYAPEAVSNTHKISERCNVTLEFGHYKLPRFDVPEGYDASSYLEKLCLDGLKERYPLHYTEHLDRLNYELDTIRTMGFVDYFLIVWDFIRFAKEHDIPVGPGRGSAAGSIVAYSLRITDIDPIRYNLLFERFLNPERVTMPDIDVDFCFERREEVIEYVTEKYGADRVCQIVTFGTMLAKGVIRDVARAMDFPYSEANNLAKMVPNDLHMTLDLAMSMNPELKEAVDGDPRVGKLMEIAKRLEGLPRHASTHAAGVVISNAPVDDYVPLSRSGDGSVTAQYNMTTLEELGLLKMDFLGLRTLTVLKNAERFIREREPEFSIDGIDYEDPKVYALIGSGKTEGIFQLESTGMKAFMKELAPTCLEDVVAGISLYRPGPMDFIPKYLAGKNDREHIQYDCPELRPILEPTYGCIVYQEQVMQIVRDLAGYSFGRSDLVRRAMSKKKAAVMAKERENFVYGNAEEGVPGCKARGIPEEVANRIYDEMTDFAKYAFNKSHAACYAVVAYRTAYLKYYYPAEFMAALITSIMDNTTKLTGYISCLRQMGIELLPPDVNESASGFGVGEKDGKRFIRYGLTAIKGLGFSVTENIVRERRENGPYRDLADFISRLDERDRNKRTVENCIKAGALDSVPGTRKQKMLVYTAILENLNREKKNSVSGQLSLFDFMGEEESTVSVPFPDCGEYELTELLALEKDVLGFYASGHPLRDEISLMERIVTKWARDFEKDEESGEANVEDGSYETIGGILVSKTTKTTRSNSMMCFLNLEDTTGTVEVLVFPRDYERCRGQFTEDSRLFIRGRVSVEEDKPNKLIFSEAASFSEVPMELWLRFPNKDAFLREEPRLPELLAAEEGNDRVIVFLSEEHSMKTLPQYSRMKLTAELRERVEKALGADRVAVRPGKLTFGKKTGRPAE